MPFALPLSDTAHSPTFYLWQALQQPLRTRSKVTEHLMRSLFPYSPLELPPSHVSARDLPKWTQRFSCLHTMSLLPGCSLCWLWWLLDRRWWNLKSAFNEATIPFRVIFVPFPQGEESLGLVIWQDLHMYAPIPTLNSLSSVGNGNCLEVRGGRGRTEDKELSL